MGRKWPNFWKLKIAVFSSIISTKITSEFIFMSKMRYYDSGIMLQCIWGGNVFSVVWGEIYFFKTECFSIFKYSIYEVTLEVTSYVCNRSKICLNVVPLRWPPPPGFLDCMKTLPRQNSWVMKLMNENNTL